MILAALQLEFRMMKLHEVGRIQPVGAMVAYDARTEILCAASENTALFLDRWSAEKALGQSVEKSLSGKLLHALRNAAALPSLSKEPEPLGVFEFGRGPLDARAHQRDYLIIVELLPSEPEPSALRLMKDVSRLAFSANHSTTPIVAFQDIAKLLRLMSGYERVQFAKFTSDGSGQVIADTYRPDTGTPVPLSFSKSNRALNFVADTSYQPIQVIGNFAGPLDMKYCQFVFPRAKTLDRLHQSGAKSELSQPIYQNNQLWGQVVFQSQVPQIPTTRFQYTFQCAMPVILSTVARLEVSQTLV